MTRTVFSEDAYQKSCTARVIGVEDNAVVLDETVFYPLGGGQPGDTGVLKRATGEVFKVIDTRKGESGVIRHVLGEGMPLPEIGDEIVAELDWERRYKHMRMHTGLHLLGSVLRYGVTGGSIGAEKSRLDFDMQETVDKEAVTQALNVLIEADHTVGTRWITDKELDAQPELIRTMSVKPPRGADRVRLLEIPGVDLQPCGGTHVAHTAEIGPMMVSKVEKKGKRNRRVYVKFVE